MKHSKPPRNRAVEDVFYHSGFQKEANFVQTKAEAILASEVDTRDLIRVVFKTVKYTAPLPIGITTSIDWAKIAPMAWH